MALAAILWLVRLLLPRVLPDTAAIAMLGAAGAGAAIALWWLLFSRAPWLDRAGGLIMMAAALLLTAQLAHPSIAGGMMGMMPYMYGLPVVATGLVLWAAASRNSEGTARYGSLAVAALLSAVPLALVRTGGIHGDAGADLFWRWTQDAEERLLAASPELPPPTPAPVSPATPPEPTVVKEPAAPASPAPAPPAVAANPSSWTGFRGPSRDGVVSGLRIRADWSAAPPKELWRRAVGPGWSSFAVRDGLVYTQEQRGDDEIVSCYRAATGEPVWAHRDATRFWESNAGAGPRSTPTLAGNRVYTLGATGILNALDASTGSRIWTRAAAKEAEVETPDWGFASSPLIHGDMVIVALAGKLAAYDRETGEPRWQGPASGMSYSSPHLASIDGVPQVILVSSKGVTSVLPADGSQLWRHDWQGFASLQPALLPDGGMLIATGGPMGGQGSRRLAVQHSPNGWAAAEQWTSNGLKPYFNDLAIHKGHAYGFDGSILSCINLEDGQRKWKGGRYGHGQMLLLADQDLLLIVSEDGELALVSATPDQHQEVAKVPALNSKTWNHPALAGDLLLLRNGEEMVAFRLAASD